MTAAQEKPKALKFDEFADVVEDPFYSDDKFISFRERVERFSSSWKKKVVQPFTGFTIKPALFSRNSGYRKFVDRVKGIENNIKYNERIKVKDIVIVDGGYRENNMVEFWIVPENAEPSAPRPTVEKSNVFVCPNVRVFGEVQARTQIQSYFRHLQF